MSEEQKETIENKQGINIQLKKEESNKNSRSSSESFDPILNLNISSSLSKAKFSENSKDSKNL